MTGKLTAIIALSIALVVVGWAIWLIGTAFGSELYALGVDGQNRRVYIDPVSDGLTRRIDMISMTDEIIDRMLAGLSSCSWTLSPSNDDGRVNYHARVGDDYVLVIDAGPVMTEDYTAPIDGPVRLIGVEAPEVRASLHDWIGNEQDARRWSFGPARAEVSVTRDDLSALRAAISARGSYADTWTDSVWLRREMVREALSRLAAADLRPADNDAIRAEYRRMHCYS